MIRRCYKSFVMYLCFDVKCHYHYPDWGKWSYYTNYLTDMFIWATKKKEKKSWKIDWFFELHWGLGEKIRQTFKASQDTFCMDSIDIGFFFATELIINDVSVIFLQGFYRQWSEEIHQIKCYEKFALQLEWNFRYSLNTVQKLPEIISACKL